MITWVTEDLCISAQRSSREKEFSSLALHLYKLDMGCKPKQIYLAVSFYFCQAFTDPLHFNTTGWERSYSSPAVPTHYRWLWGKELHILLKGHQSEIFWVASSSLWCHGTLSGTPLSIKKCIKWILLFRTSCSPPLRSIERNSGIREE